jgi:hypothetical protein
MFKVQLHAALTAIYAPAVDFNNVLGDPYYYKSWNTADPYITRCVVLEKLQERFTVQEQKIFPKVQTVEKLLQPAQATGRITLKLQSSRMRYCLTL